MNRRDMIKRSGMAAGGFALGTAFTAPACNPKNLSVYVETIVGTLRELQPFLPGSAKLIVEAIKIADDFDVAYKAGNFASASALFANLAGLIGQVAADAGVNNPTVKIALAVAGVAMRAIAVLLKSQSSQPAVAGAVRARTASSPAARAQASLIERLADDAAIDSLFAAVRF